MLSVQGLGGSRMEHETTGCIWGMPKPPQAIPMPPVKVNITGIEVLGYICNAIGVMRTHMGRTQITEP